VNGRTMRYPEGPGGGPRPTCCRTETGSGPSTSNKQSCLLKDKDQLARRPGRKLLTLRHGRRTRGRPTGRRSRATIARIASKEITVFRTLVHEDSSRSKVFQHK